LHKDQTPRYPPRGRQTPHLRGEEKYWPVDETRVVSSDIPFLSVDHCFHMLASPASRKCFIRWRGTLGTDQHVGDRAPALRAFAAVAAPHLCGCLPFFDAGRSDGSWHSQSRGV